MPLCAFLFVGCGDFCVRDMSYLSDPCPLPSSEKKRSLDQKERLIYAPMSGVGGIVYDKDAVYIELGGSHSHQTTLDEVGIFWFCLKINVSHL